MAGQRLVLDLRGLKTRTYATRDLSREVDLQLEALAEANCLSLPGQHEMVDPEGVESRLELGITDQN